MSKDAVCTIAGNLSRDPELRYASTGTAVCKFSVAVNEGRFNRDTNKYEETGVSFFDCTAFGQMAENVSESLVKGNRVVVSGTLKQDQWEDKETGDKRSKIVVMVDSVGPDLRWASAEVVRNERSDKSTTGPPREDNPFG